MPLIRILGCSIVLWISAVGFAAPPLAISAGKALIDLSPRADHEEFRWRGWIPAGGLVEVNGLIGHIYAEHTDNDEVEVLAVKQGEDRLDDVQIEVIEHSRGVTVCAVYPSRNSEQRFECRPSPGGGFRVASASGTDARVKFGHGGGGDVDLAGVRVDFVVKIPSRVRFLGRTFDGDIDVRSLDREIEAHSVVGDVHVRMPANAASLVHAESLQGSVYSDFPLQVSSGSHTNGMLVKGSIGGGRHSLTVRTLKGSIHLRKSG